MSKLNSVRESLLTTYLYEHLRTCKHLCLECVQSSWNSRPQRESGSQVMQKKFLQLL